MGQMCSICAAVQIPAHPEYPSGHTFTVGAVLEVLNRTLNGKDDVSDDCGLHICLLMSLAMLATAVWPWPHVTAGAASLGDLHCPACTLRLWL